MNWGGKFAFKLLKLARKSTPEMELYSHALPRLLAEPVGASRVGQALRAGGAGEPGPAPALAWLRAEPVVLVAAVPADRLVAELRGAISPLL